MPDFAGLCGRIATLALAFASTFACAQDAATTAPSELATEHSVPRSATGHPQPKSVAEKVEGLWCGTGLLHEFSLRLSQHYQELQGTLSRKQRVRQIRGRMEGRTLYTQATKVGSLVLELTGDELRIVGGEGRIALVRGMAFKRAATDRCGG